MHEHFYDNGKKACCLDPANRVVEIAFKHFKALVQFNSDGSATVTNYDLQGNPTEFTYPVRTTT